MAAKISAQGQASPRRTLVLRAQRQRELAVRAGVQRALGGGAEGETAAEHQEAGDCQAMTATTATVMIRTGRARRPDGIVGTPRSGSW